MREYIQHFARVLLCMTFLEDAYRISTDFDSQVDPHTQALFFFERTHFPAFVCGGLSLCLSGCVIWFRNLVNPRRCVVCKYVDIYDTFT